MNRKLIIALGCFFLLGIWKVEAQAPVPDFSATPVSGCNPLNVQFKDLSTNNPTNWSWDFGNGQISSLQNPGVQYPSPGTYTVTLIVRNAAGANAIRKTDLITVFPSPAVNFTSNLKVACAPAGIQFTDLSTPGQGTITQWAWGFGDGTTAGDQNPAHFYNQPGYYNVSLRVTNSFGCAGGTNVLRYLRIVDGIQPNFSFDQTSASCTAPFVVNFLNQTAGPGTLTYAWTFGTGATPGNSTATNPAGITYPSNGQYTVGLQVQSSMGCTQTFQKNINFSSYTATFDGPPAICVNNPATFTNSSTPTPGSNIWDFGSGSTSTANPATWTYNAIGTYNIKLVNRYTGCTDSLTKPIQVLNPPVAKFTSDVTSACQPNLTVHFTDQSTGSPNHWLWDFGDGQTDTAANPTHVYTSTGTFDVKLTVTSIGGCSGTTTTTGLITIKGPQISINNANNLGACAAGSTGGSSNTVTPTVTVTSIDPAASYNWTAPGSNEGSSTSATPSFTYNTPGDYTISVTVTTAGGCTSQAATSTVQIGTPTTPDFTISSPDDPTYVCGRDTVTFTATPTGTYTYTWDFGDGATTAPQNSPTIKHSYSQPYYPANVYLTLTSHGCPAAKTHPLKVNLPFPNFGFKVNCATSYLNVTFIDSSKIDAAASSYTWHFDDGTTATSLAGTGTTKQFSAPGVHPVTLTISDGVCLNQSFTKNITTLNVTPVMAITIGQIPGLAPPAICKKTPAQLRNASTLSPGVLPSSDNYLQDYIWQIDAGTPDTTTDPEHDIIIPTNGPHTIKFSVIDNNGCPWAASPYAIQVIGPTAQFTSPSPDGGCKNKAVTFTDNSTTGPAAITQWNWNFGDGQSSSSQNVTHSYADTGFFHVSLKVTDANTCSDTYTAPDSIQITSPISAFAGPDSFYCPGVPLHFLDSAQGYGIQQVWNYGDGSPTDSVHSHTYATPGQTYTVTLTVTDKYNCTSTTTKPVAIQKPVAAFDIADTTAICVPLQTQFTSHSQFYDSLYWDFGDGSTSTLPVTSHFYNTLDTFVAKLYVRGPGGCFDSASRRVLVLDPNATTKLNFSPLYHCDSLLVNFSIVVPGYTTFSLAFGDGKGDSSGNASLSHLYRNPGHYSPSLQLTDATGCIVSIGNPTPIWILGATPFFSVSKHSFCDSGLVAFTDFTISNNGYYKETYTFGDGSPSQTQSPGTGAFNITNYFSKPGTWPVVLTVSTDSGCVESYNDTIRVYQTPHPSIALGGLPCAGIIQFQGSIDAPQVDTIDWAWNFGNGQTSGLQNPAVRMTPGDYIITLKTSTILGCTDTTSKAITVHPTPVITGPKELTTPLGFPVTIPFTYTGGTLTYNWSPPTSLDCPTCPNPVATLIFSTQYAVNVTDSNGCTAIDSILIKTICNTDNIFMPNTFSPNGDGVNDVFYPRGKSLYNVQSLTVFNRWGQMVFQRRDFPANTQSMGWDGNFNGRPAPADTYVYIVEVICENAQVVALHGNVTLIR